MLIRSSIVGHKEFSAFEGFPLSPPLFLFLGFAASKASLFFHPPLHLPLPKEMLSKQDIIYTVVLDVSTFTIDSVVT